MDTGEETRRPILQMKKRKNRQTKSVLVFDDTARREYLTGFQKRKNQRRKKAKLENEKKMKEEKKALKQKVRDMVQKSDRHRLPEVEEFLNSTVHELPDHTVTITDMSERLTSTQPEPNTDQQDSKEQNEYDDEDSDTLKRKRKKLIHKLAKMGNPPNPKKKKVKRLGKGKFSAQHEGGHSGGGGSSSSSSKKSKKNSSKNKKHRHK